MVIDLVNNLWVIICGMLVFLMQIGFLCFESGYTRSKNSVNVAMKNVADFILAVIVFWLLGFGLMFGDSAFAFLGMSHFAPDLGREGYWQATFFLFQAMFCATAVTIVSGAVAERVRFNGYLLISIAVAAVIYPVSGHWVWASAFSAQPGWLETMGFVDFAGSTLVHSVGGWVALALLLEVGPRNGRFAKDAVNTITSSNPTLVLIGTMFFVVGWLGFNGGSTLALDGRVPGIIANTLMAAVAGAAMSYSLKKLFPTKILLDELASPCNGLLAGLVAITASCHAVTTVEAVIIGAAGAVVMLAANNWMLRHHLDDAVSAIPVHLGAGVWGTLAVALFGDPAALTTGLTMWHQLAVQISGIVVIGLWAFLSALLIIKLIGRFKPLRVSAEEEAKGLNVSEHGTRSDLLDLLDAMDEQQASLDMSKRVPEQSFTEVGQIACRYNQVMGALEGAVKQTRAIVRDIRDAIVTFNSNGLITSFNPGAEKIFGLPAHSVIGSQFVQLLDEEESSPYGQRFSGDDTERFHLDQTHELRGRRAVSADSPDRSFYLEMTVTKSQLEDHAQYTALIRDIDDRKTIEEKLYRQQERAHVTLSSIADGVITTDTEGNILLLNQAAEVLTGWSQQEARGKPFDEVFCLSRAKERHQSVVEKVLKGHISVQEEASVVLLSRQGNKHTITRTAAPIRNHKNSVFGVVVVFHDITAKQQLQHQLDHQVNHDSLTGLLNRTAFETLAGELIMDAMSGEKTHVLGYLDLDEFKLINDTSGHVAGDELLQRIPELLQGLIRQGDVVARLGGDEFGLLLCNCPADHGYQVAEKIREAISHYRFAWETNVFSLSVSIGLVSITNQTENLALLLSTADSACYMAKEAGRNRVHMYQPDNEELLLRKGQMQWVARIREALDKDLFRLYFQPIVPANTHGKNQGHIEIFIRMVDNDQTIIPPGAFIPAAERYHLMQEIDFWVVKNTFAWLSGQLHKQPDSVALCCINLSGTSVGDLSALDYIKEYLELYRIPPELVCFEVTETEAVANLDAANRLIKELKKIGCLFALDDFGSGLSSFEYLKNLAVDYLKIDGAFVKAIDQDNIDKVMVTSINTIGHEMGLKTIAEFVSSAAILEELRGIGVDYVQGYYLGKPAPLESFAVSHPESATETPGEDKKHPL